MSQPEAPRHALPIFSEANSLEVGTYTAAQGSPELLFMPADAAGELALRAVEMADVEAVFDEYQDWQENDQSYEALVDIVAQLVQVRHGSPIEWKENGVTKDTMPAILRPVIEHSLFARQCIRHELQVNDFGPAQLRRLRQTERVLLEEIGGIPPDLSRDFRLAIQKRTMKINKEGYIAPLDKGGGIDEKEWRQAMAVFIENYNSLEVSEVEAIRGLFKTVNFDRYTHTQLKRMARFAQKDPEIIEQLRNSNLVLHFSDSFGDDGGAFTLDPEHFDNDGNSLFFEITQPSDIYRALITLDKEYDIQSSCIVISLHGDPGYMDVGGEGRKFLITSHASEQGARVVNLTKANLERLLHEYMKPHSHSGRRHVILGSCGQAQKGKESQLSIAETIALASSVADQVVVSAAKDIIMIESDGRHIYFITGDGHRAVIHHFRKSDGQGPRLIKTMSSKILM